jgi:hypothetical protein
VAVDAPHPTAPDLDHALHDWVLQFSGRGADSACKYLSCIQQ